MKRIFALVICLFWSAAFAAPATPTYDIEVVVFDNSWPELEGGELWTKDAARNPIANLAQAILPEETPAADSALRGAVAALERDGHHVLAYRRWRQGADEKSATKPVRLRDTTGQLDGTAKFYLSTYLHLELDLLLQATGAPAYRLTEHRHVKAQELNYFDHPKFGALVKVTTVGKE